MIVFRILSISSAALVLIAIGLSMADAHEKAIECLLTSAVVSLWAAHFQQEEK